ncbi:MAG: DUF418 domain-containing protein [Bacteroidales bacterium]|nr:DUF418 domain-containing protein [Bacteroidales bacterium]
MATKTTRIDAADVLRGIAVIGIILVHSVEHFNFISFADAAEQCAFLNFTDRVVWDSLFFIFGGKGYAIFALLFGFSFFIQDSNQQAKGKDFRMRFVWRLFLLFLIGLFDALFYSGDILVLYAAMGLILPIVCRLPNRAVLWIAVALILQPMEWWKLDHALLDPTYLPGNGWFDASFLTLAPVQSGGTFWEACKANFMEGQFANMNWYVANGRITQTAGLFVIGLLMGSKGLLTGGEKNLKFWFGIICWAAVVFFAAEGLLNLVQEFIERGNVLRPLRLILKSYGNMGVTFALVGGIMILFYTTKLHVPLMKIAPYGRMSLTNYLSQSILGTMIFHNWGFGLWDNLGITYSVFVGVAIIAVQIVFCRWWLQSHRQGPVEWAWKKATWLFSLEWKDR